MCIVQQRDQTHMRTASGGHIVVWGVAILVHCDVLGSTCQRLL
jgi:hypothetical protein